MSPGLWRKDSQPHKICKLEGNGKVNWPNAPISYYGKESLERLKCRWKIYECSFTKSRSTWGFIPRRNVKQVWRTCNVPPLAKPVLTAIDSQMAIDTHLALNSFLSDSNHSKEGKYDYIKEPPAKKACGRLCSHIKHQKDKFKNSWAPWEVSHLWGSTQRQNPGSGWLRGHLEWVPWSHAAPVSPFVNQ